MTEWNYVFVTERDMCDTFKLKMGSCENMMFRLDPMGCEFLLKTHFQLERVKGINYYFDIHCNHMIPVMKEFPFYFTVSNILYSI